MATIGAGGQLRSRKRIAGQGRTHALAGQDAAQPRRDHESGGPPARRRRRQDFGRTPSGDPVGPADARIQDAQQQAHGQVDRDAARARRGNPMGRSVKKGPFTDTHLEAKMAVLDGRQRKKSGAHVVAPLHHSSGIRRSYRSGSQRQEIHSGLRHREHGGAQAGRVFADPHIQRPFGEGGYGKVGQAGIRGVSMQAKAEARYIRISAQKARLVVDLIRGKQAGAAINTLRASQQAHRAHGGEGSAIGHRQRAESQRRCGCGRAGSERSLRQRRAAHEAGPPGADGPRLPLSAALVAYRRQSGG